MATQLWQIGLMVIGSLVGATAPILLKISTKKSSNAKKVKKSLFGLILRILNLEMILGLMIYGISYVVTIPALKTGDLSILYPFISFTYIWVALLSVKYLNERMNIVKWGGIGLIIIGVIFIGLGI